MYGRKIKFKWVWTENGYACFENSEEKHLNPIYIERREMSCNNNLSIVVSCRMGQKSNGKFLTIFFFQDTGKVGFKRYDTQKSKQAHWRNFQCTWELKIDTEAVGNFFIGTYQHFRSFCLLFPFSKWLRNHICFEFQHYHTSVLRTLFSKD